MRIIQISQVTGEEDLNKDLDGSMQESILDHLEWMSEYAGGLKNSNPSRPGRKMRSPRRKRDNNP